MRSAPLLALVIPCYNEQEILPQTQATLANLLAECKKAGQIAPDSFILYVDDGSKDQTWQIISQRHQHDSSCRGLRFAINAGHQNAVMAGMEQALAWGVDCIISLDADLQDDINIIPEMLANYCQGCEIVYGVRNDRSTDTKFKRNTANAFYKFMELAGAKLIPNHADFRLVSKRILQDLANYPERDLFLRGLFPSMGYKTANVYYRRLERSAGVTKYSLPKMLSFAWHGLLACSIRPLRIAAFMSVLCMLAAVFTSFFALIRYFQGQVIQGWTSLIIVVLILGAIQLGCLAIMGEYIALLVVEMRHRPRYLTAEILPKLEDAKENLK